MARPKGSGNGVLIEVERSRRYLLRVSTGRDPITGAYGRWNETFSGNKTDAKERLAEMVRDVAAGRHRQTKGTVAYLLEHHLEALRRKPASPKTLYTYEGYIRKNILPALGELRLDELKAAHLNRFYAALADRGLSPATIRQHHAIISGALKRAERLDWVLVNVARKASPPDPPEAESPAERAPEPSEVVALIDAALHGDTSPPERRGGNGATVVRRQPNPELAVLFFVASTTGARRGELCALQWSDVDLEGRSLTVADAIYDVPGAVGRKRTKSKRGRRTFALDEMTVTTLLAHREAMAARAAAAGSALGGDSYVWSQAADLSAPYRPDRVGQYFRRLRDALGLSDVRLHDLRHFAGTELVAAGFDPVTVAARLGNDPAVLLRVYASVRPATDRLAAEHMAKVLARPLPLSLPAPGG